MPNRRNGRKNGNGNTAIMHGHVQKTQVITTGAAGLYTFSLTPILTDVTTQLASVYRYYRFTKIKFTMYPNTTSNFMAQYLAGGGSTTVGVADGQMESKLVTAVGAFLTVPQTMTITAKDMLNQVPWFVTDLDAVDEYIDTIGYIAVENSSASALQLLVRWEVDYEFKYPQHTEISVSKREAIRDKQSRTAAECKTTEKVVYRYVQTNPA